MKIQRPTSWLVVVDMQRIFGEPDSPWFTPGFERALAGTLRLRPAFAGRVALTRFVPPDKPEGAWVSYYATWTFALEAATAPRYAVVPALANTEAVTIDRTTFGKWDAAAQAQLTDVNDIVLTGVSTDCCVLATALAAADAGIHVCVAADACAGIDDHTHQRALDAMALYAPLIEVTSIDAILAVAAERRTISAR